ncbi:hypothetical protein BDQ12DRAFT_608082 [Crucibulum laeve]|uniref:Uncharacterized protein n=1 Tax=Crucibulum laeve TaxID=68775 RepID=A0A5C3LJP1_9AGAR|nr:hypothetical protein BDQ12DRAFT_616160 [Crucibulum laeve]TFK37313.1 hypothetical protein BDQ12DRAFT_608082 [Crucibulum laeve]
MQLTSFVTLTIAIATAKAATVSFYTARNCNSASWVQQNVGCNTCVDPPGDWWAASVSGISGDQRVSMHNQNSCTSASSVGQWYGNICAAAGNTALRSVWVACSGQRA